MPRALLLPLALVALLAGCAAPEESSDAVPPGEGANASSAGAACVGGTDDPGGYDQSGSTQPGKVGNAAGDITADTSCPAPASA